LISVKIATAVDETVLFICFEPLQNQEITLKFRIASVLTATLLSVGLAQAAKR
jgi:hypothetical protein